jgi:GNAT superfamily N-acetyltransferase
MPHIRLVQDAVEIDRCFAVMHQLRPALVAEEFVARVEAQRAQGYQLASLEHDGKMVCVAGFRIQRMLSSGNTLYVDDLVTDAAHRSAGHGEAMLTWLIAYAREAGCESFSLDSGTQRQSAHAFYFREGMRIASFHFHLPL